MYFHIFIFSVLLFFVLTPGVLLRLPPNGSKYVVALVHGLVFALLFTLSLKYYKEVLLKEGMKEAYNKPKSTNSPK
jgi:hypothetical protein